MTTTHNEAAERLLGTIAIAPALDGRAREALTESIEEALAAERRWALEPLQQIVSLARLTNDQFNYSQKLNLIASIAQHALDGAVMTTTTRNEIAEQVLVAVQIGVPVDWKASLYAVAAAERRATVKRIRDAVERYDVMFEQDFWDELEA